jgi:hypothetical protein
MLGCTKLLLSIHITMDPLSITVGALGAGKLVAICAFKLRNLQSRYSLADLTLSSMAAECSMIQAQLCEVQRYASEESNECEERLVLRPHLRSALDTSLTSCMVTFSILEVELEKIGISMTGLGMKSKLRFLWEKTPMKELLLDMRAQTSAISHFLTAVQW